MYACAYTYIYICIHMAGSKNGIIIWLCITKRMRWARWSKAVLKREFRKFPEGFRKFSRKRTYTLSH